MPQAILLQDVDSLGEKGTVVDVSPGYLRNYLLPRNLAVEANQKNIREFEHNKRVSMLKRERQKSQALTLKEKVEALALVIKARAGEEGKLFGSVTNIDIERALREKGFDIERRKIHLPEPLKRLGEFQVAIRLEAEVEASLKVEVAAE